MKAFIFSGSGNPFALRADSSTLTSLISPMNCVLYDVGVYPAVRKGIGAVYGELYEIDDKKINELDTIEGYYPEDNDQSLYVRKEVDITLSHDGSLEKASAYFFNYDNGVLLTNQIGR